MSAKTHAGNVFVTPDLDPKINGFSELIVEHSYVKLSDASVWRYSAKKRQIEINGGKTVKHYPVDCRWRE